jgi:hypothetical protein
MQSNEFRILGPVLGEPDGYIDIVVAGLGENGDIYFQARDDKSREWSLSSERVQNLMKENKLLRSEEVEQHKLWERVRNLGKDVNKGRVSSPFAKESVAEAQAMLFDAAFEESRS